MRRNRRRERGVVAVALGATLAVAAAASVAVGICLTSGQPGEAVRAAGTAATNTDLTPNALAVDHDGNVYVADFAHDVVEEVAPATGNITVVAGERDHRGAPTLPGSASSSQLSNPAGLATDGQGDLYIADAGTNSIVETVTPSGGSIEAGVVGHFDPPVPGPATSSDLLSPGGVAVDTAGNVYIADSLHAVVEKVDTSGQLSIVAGQSTTFGPPIVGPAVNSYLYDPTAVAVDSDGNVYIADTGNRVVEKIDHATGILSIVAGVPDQVGPPQTGTATQSDLGDPTGLAIDGNELYIADPANNVIEQVGLSSGDLSLVAGTGTAGLPTPGAAAVSQLDKPSAVAVDSGHDLFVADTGNNLVEMISGGTLSILAGSGAPSVSSVTPAAGPQAAGTSVTVAGTGFTSATNVHFGPHPGTGLTVNSATSMTVTAPAGTGTVDVTVTGPNGMSTTSPRDTFTYTVPQQGPSNPAEQTITLVPPTAAAAGQADTPLAGKASSGLPVTYTSATPTVCTVTSAGLLHTVAAGQCTITTAQPGNDAYAPASPVTETFTVAGFTAAGPTRVLDTRTGPAAAPVGPKSTITLTVPNLPAGVTAVVLNLTATDLTGAPDTYVSACPAAQPTASCATTSVLNPVAGAATSNEITVPVGPDGKITLYNNTGHIDLVADLTGYITGAFTAAGPTRVLDTRTGPAAAPVGPKSTITLTVPNLPAGVTAVVLNLTATDLTGAPDTYVSACPAAQPTASCATTSVLNPVAGAATSNEITVPVGPDGKITLYNNTGHIDLVADLTGYITGAFTAAGPTRVLDTRTGPAAAPVGPKSTITLTVPNLPAGVTAVVLNLTATDLTGAPDTYVSACPAAQPTASCATTSVLNPVAGAATSNEITVPVGPDGKITLYNNTGHIDLVADLTGYVS